MPVLKEEVRKEKVIEVITKRALVASECSCCKKVFKMERYCNDQLTPAVMKGIFDSGAIDENGRGLGNMFETLVCSFSCADEIFKGGWKNIPKFKPYVDAKAEIVRIELGLTSLMKEKEELLEEWENMPEESSVY